MYRLQGLNVGIICILGHLGPSRARGDNNSLKRINTRCKADGLHTFGVQVVVFFSGSHQALVHLGRQACKL